MMTNPFDYLFWRGGDEFTPPHR